MRVEGEAADDQQVEADALDRFLGGLLDLSAAPTVPYSGPIETATRHGLPSASVYSPSAWIHCAGERVEPVEGEPLALVRVLHAGLAEVVEDHRARTRAGAGVARGRRARVGGRSSSVESTRCGDRLSTVNGPVTRTLLVVLVGLVVQRLGLGVPGDRRVDLLAGHPLLDVRVVGDAT